jgi:hypothetical protein
MLIKRAGFHVIKNNIKDKKTCPNCKTKIPLICKNYKVKIAP